MKYITVNGDDYNMGKMIGSYFSDYLNKNKDKYLQRLNDEDVLNKVRYLENKLKDEFPLCLSEIYGRADGANINRDVMLLMFFPEIFKKKDGCTTLIMKDKNDKFLLSHNEDDINYSKDNVALIKYDYKDYWIIGYTVAEKLMGSSFGFNSYGIIFSSNCIYDTKIELNNISRYIAVRSITNASSLDELINKLKDINVASAFSYNVIDTKANKAANIEKDIKDIYLTNINDRYARANHFTTKKFDLNEVPKSSKFRDEYVNKEIIKLDNNSVKLEDLKNILAYKSADYYTSVYKDPNKYKDLSVTVANFSYDGNKNEIIIKDYLDNSELRFKL